MAMNVLTKRVKPIIKQLLFELQNERCAWCGVRMWICPSQQLPSLLKKKKPVAMRAATFDHLICKSQGGRDEFNNVVLACYRCNHLRDNMSVKDFLLTLYAGAGNLI